MNCRQARALFSNRIDHELATRDTQRLERHVAVCRECQAKWESFELTVRMVRTLPQAAPDASFVGQVLDRVRGYEAENRAREREARIGILDRIRDGLEGALWRRLQLPVQLAGAAAFGLLAGFVVTQTHLLSGRVPMTMTAAIQGSVPFSSASAVAGVVQSRRPFDDLVGTIAERQGSGNSDSAAAVRSPSSDAASGVLQGSGAERQVSLSADGRPQITF